MLLMEIAIEVGLYKHCDFHREQSFSLIPWMEMKKRKKKPSAWIDYYDEVARAKKKNRRIKSKDTLIKL